MPAGRRDPQGHRSVDHEGIWSSIYFFDPNGIRIELTHQSRPLGERDAEEGRALVEQWVAERGQSLGD